MEAAAGNEHTDKEATKLLLDRRGADVCTTEEVVETAAGNYCNGKVSERSHILSMFQKPPKTKYRRLVK